MKKFDLIEVTDESMSFVHFEISEYALAKYAISLLSDSERTEIFDNYCGYCGKLHKACSEEIEENKIKNDKINY